MQLHENVWKESHTIKYSQVGSNFKLKLTAIIELFKEAAHSHSNTSGYGHTKMIVLRKVWVLNNIKIKFITNAPLGGESITLETWVKKVEDKHIERDFIIRNTMGDIFLKGTSSWYTVDLHSKKTVPLGNLAEQISIPKDLSALDGLRVVNLPSYVDKKEYLTARYSDIDATDYVSTSRYASWALDHYPKEIFSMYRMTSFEANFIKPTLLGEKLIYRLERFENAPEQTMALTSSMTNFTTDKLVAVIETQWEETHAKKFGM